MRNPLSGTVRLAALAAGALSLLLPGAALAQAYQWQNLTASDAIQAVRNFEGNQSLAVTVTQNPAPNPGGPASGYVYELTTAGCEYMVSEYASTDFGKTNKQFSSNPSAFYGTTYSSSSPPGTLLTQSQCQAIAQSFMQAHYPNPSLFGSPAVGTTLGNAGSTWTRQYTFTYDQWLGTSTTGPSLCQVGVDTVLGQVVYYSQCYYPVNVSLTASLTSSQAAADAAAALQLSGATMSQVVGLAVSKPDPYGWDALAYGMYVVGQGPNDIGPTPHWIAANANNGQVLEYGVTMGGVIGGRKTGRPLPPAGPTPFLLVSQGGKPLHLSHPPALINGKPCFWAGYLGKGTSLKDARKVGRDDYVPLDYASRQMNASLTYHTRDRVVEIEARPGQGPMAGSSTRTGFLLGGAGATCVLALGVTIGRRRRGAL